MNQTLSALKYGEPPAHIATDDIQGIAEREVSSQLGGTDHRPLVISIKGQIQSNAYKLPASRNCKNPTGGRFRVAVNRKLQHCNQSVALFNKAVLEAAKIFISRERRWHCQPYCTPELDNLPKALDQAREKVECSPTNANVEAHSKAKAKTQATRNSRHEKTGSLNMEKDTTGLWNLTNSSR